MLTAEKVSYLPADPTIVGTTAQLLCEGRCNGNLVKPFQVQLTRQGRLTADFLFAREFLHTEHRATEQLNHWQCSNCGTVRRWGKHEYE